MRPFLPFATLLGAAFLLGCQEQASSPVGLEGLGPQFGAKKCVLDNTLPGCRGGDEEGGMGGVPADLTMTGGMTASAQPVEFQDGENILNFSAFGDQAITLAMELTATQGDGIGACTPFSRKKADPFPSAGFTTLFSKLTDASQVRDGGFFVHIDKNALTAPFNEHTITVVWEDADGSFTVTVGRHFNTEPGESTVTLVGDLSTGNVTVTFTGGSIKLRDKTGKVPEHFNLTCPIPDADVITMVLTAA